MTLSGKNWIFYGLVIDHIGTKFGYSEITQCIEHYEGSKPLKELHITAFDHLPEDKKLSKREILISRGRKFVGIHGKRHLWFKDAPGKSSGYISNALILV
ncbi:hypothetical protein FPSE_00213 [Fusarium pseudograminearum CS3096]|uniref:Uncharacterized protein n=1 Tax=Fusarium pseudograminearum (strain CS3096) TaxID=1028729 RepID=K3VWK4_FUSPC|nr:hypothetical protein FPSE_00213 [Fusarium pseudograminearum CS3096]EKJ79528.1 hypothetical protein FPSE_00213 [Fusarium pseudograminearum CS3096]